MTKHIKPACDRFRFRLPLQVQYCLRFIKPIALRSLTGHFLTTLFFVLTLAGCALGGQADKHHKWVSHSSFKDFASGTFGDGGSNIYISAAGRIQMIHRWDLNNDGHLDLMVGQDHANVENEDVLIYWGTRQGPRSLMPPMPEHQPLGRLLRQIRLREKGVTRLPSLGGGRCLLLDLNGDEFLDIVFCNYIHNYTVNMDALIYWGSSEGYQPNHRTRLPTLMGKGIAAADFNRDGFIDLVFANEGVEGGERFGFDKHLESYIYWNGPLGFNKKNRTSLPTISANTCAAGDLNGDGFPELLFLNNNSQEKSVYLYWNGPDGFSDKRRDVWKGGDPVGAKFVDVNRDGNLDLILMHGDDRAEILLGTGRGLERKAWVELPVLEATECQVSDLNRDGFVDLVFANKATESKQVSYIYWGSVEGYSINRRTELPTLHAVDVAIADFDSDGWPDVAFANHRSDKTTDAPSYIYWNSPQGFFPAYRTELQGFGTVSADAADLNGDGHPELVLISGSSGTFQDENSPGSLIYWGNPSHYYSIASMTHLPTTGGGVAVADLDQNGYVDIAFPKGDIYWGHSSNYNPKRREKLEISNGLGVSAADLNRDGYLDLVFAAGLAFMKDQQSKGLIFWGSATGFTAKNSTELKLNTQATLNPNIADFNKDGFLDLIFPDVDSPKVDFFWGDVSGTYSVDRHTLMEVNSADTVEIADLNLDGWLDLIFGGAWDAENFGRPVSHAVLLWGGPKGFSSKRSSQLEAYCSGEQVVADLNKDGCLDIVMSNYHGYTTRSIPTFIYWGNREGTYSRQRRTNLAAESAMALTVADLNQDNWLDIVVFNHQERGDHGVGTNIFWGGPEGYSYQRRHWIQTFGVHFSMRRDIGNIYNRRLEEEYLSAALEYPNGKKPSRLRWVAQTPRGTQVKFQIRTGTSAGKLAKAEWHGPTGSESYYEHTGADLQVPANHRWLQYKSILVTPDGGSTPLLEEVHIDVALQ